MRKRSLMRLAVKPFSLLQLNMRWSSTSLAQYMVHRHKCIFTFMKLSFCSVALCGPVDCSPPDSSVRGILQPRILEWVAMPSSGGSSQTRGWTHILHWQMGSLPLAPPEKPINKSITSHSFFSYDWLIDFYIDFSFVIRDYPPNKIWSIYLTIRPML